MDAVRCEMTAGGFIRRRSPPGQDPGPHHTHVIAGGGQDPGAHHTHVGTPLSAKVGKHVKEVYARLK